MTNYDCIALAVPTDGHGPRASADGWAMYCSQFFFFSYEHINVFKFKSYDMACEAAALNDPGITGHGIGGTYCTISTGITGVQFQVKSMIRVLL